MSTTSSMSHQAAMAVDDALPVDGASQPMSFTREDLHAQGSHFDPDGVRGTRQHVSENVAENTTDVSGSVVTIPTPAELVWWLPKILGGTPSVTSFPLAEEVPEFVLQLDRIQRLFTYTGLKVGRATFRSSVGNPLELTMEMVGKTESVDAGTFPTLTLDDEQPYMHHQGVLSIFGGARSYDSVEIVIDNGLLTDKFRNSQTRDDIPEGDLNITVRADFPYDAANLDLYNQAVAGVAGSMTWTNGGLSLAFAFANLKVPKRSPNVPDRRQEIPLRLEMTAFRTASTDALVVTNDSTP